MREKTIPSICAPIAYITLCVSTTLTLMFMYKLAGDDNILKGVFLTVGLVIEIIKAILPIVIFYSFAKKQWAFACMLAAMYLVMAAISFSSSAAALEERINQSLSVSIESATNLEKIEIVKQEIEDKRVLFAEQQAANQVSKMDMTSAEISQLNTQVLQLMSGSQKAQDTVLSRYKELLIYSISGLIEVISPVMALIIMLSDTRRTTKCKEDNGVLELVQQQGNMLAELMKSKGEKEPMSVDTPKLEVEDRTLNPSAPAIALTAKEEVIIERKSTECADSRAVIEDGNVYASIEAETTTEKSLNQQRNTEEKTVKDTTKLIAATEPNFELYNSLKDGLTNKKVKPTFRDIAAKYKLGRDEITHFLSKMESEGFLLRGKGNRYTVASFEV